MADKYHRDEYTTSSLNVLAIKEQKELLRARGYPANEVLDFVNRFLKPENFGASAGSGQRVHRGTFDLAHEQHSVGLGDMELAERFGGTVVTRWATALSVTKAAKKGGIGKIREPVRFDATNPERLYSLVAVAAARSFRGGRRRGDHRRNDGRVARRFSPAMASKRRKSSRLDRPKCVKLVPATSSVWRTSWGRRICTRRWPPC